MAGLPQLRLASMAPISRLGRHLYMSPTTGLTLRAGSVRHYGNRQMTFFKRNALPINTGIRFVPQTQAWVVERMGKFHRVLPPGLAVLIPLLDKISYVQSLKENAVEIPSQSAITADNVTLEMDGILYLRIFDPYKASYGVEDAEYAVSQLAQTTMRSEIGQLTLDHVLRERQQLNHNITTAINEAAQDWGIRCLRYEIKDIHPPASVLEAMHQQVSAERSKRAQILESEGHRQSAINQAEGRRQSIILEAEATALGLEKVSQAIGRSPAGRDAVSLQVADKYVDAFGKLAKESNTVVIPAQLGDIGGMIAGGLSIFDKVRTSGLNKTTKSDVVQAGITDASSQDSKVEPDSVEPAADPKIPSLKDIVQ